MGEERISRKKDGVLFNNLVEDEMAPINNSLE